MNMAEFLSEQWGGKLAILTFAGKHAPDVFYKIHLPVAIPE